MSSWWWYLTRATGIVATVLMLASLAWGLLFSARETGKRLRPAWWLDLHNGLGGLAMIFTGLHLLCAFVDTTWGVTLATVFVPGAAADHTAAFTWGVLGFYGMAVAVFTTWPKRLFRRPVWRAIHILSVPATVAALAHAYQLGSDSSTVAFRVLLVAFAAAAMYPLGLRVSGVIASRMHRER